MKKNKTRTKFKHRSRQSQSKTGCCLKFKSSEFACSLKVNQRLKISTQIGIGIQMMILNMRFINSLHNSDDSLYEDLNSDRIIKHLELISMKYSMIESKDGQE